MAVNDSSADVYRLPVGIRTVKTSKYGIFINDVPFYFKGCGMHEDSEVVHSPMAFVHFLSALFLTCHLDQRQRIRCSNHGQRYGTARLVECQFFPHISLSIQRRKNVRSGSAGLCGHRRNASSRIKVEPKLLV